MNKKLNGDGPDSMANCSGWLATNDEKPYLLAGWLKLKLSLNKSDPIMQSPVLQVFHIHFVEKF